MTTQFVTLVAQGGTPIRICDVNGAPLPTTGSGSLVFSNGAVLTNVTLSGFSFGPPVFTNAGTQAAPSLYFVTQDRGLYTQGSNDISIAANNFTIASFQNVRDAFYFSATSNQIKLFADTSGEALISARNLADSASNILTFQKYAGNVQIGAGLVAHTANDGNEKVYGLITAGYLDTLVAGGNVNYGHLIGNTTLGVYAGTGAPTISVDRGSIYIRNDNTGVPGAPYFNTNAASTWDQFVGVNATQTLNNKTLASPIVTGTITTPQVTAPAATNLILNAPTGQQLNFDINTSSVISMSSSELFPAVDNVTTLGDATHRWSDFRSNTATFSGTVTGPTLTGPAATNLALNAVTGQNVQLQVNGTAVVTAAGALVTVAQALNYGGVTLNNAVTGTGNMVLSTSPTLTTPNIGAATGASLSVTGAVTDFNATGIPAGGAAGTGYNFSSTANFGTYFGSGAPTLSAAQGSLYYRSDGGPYYNTNGSTGWSPLLLGLTAGVGTTYLGSTTALGTAPTFTSILNTGSIGAAGQVWYISAGCLMINNNSGTNTGILFITDGTNNYSEAESAVGGGGFEITLYSSVVVTLTGATTFTLKAAGNAANMSALTSGNGTGVPTNKSTYIMAVRLA